MAIPNATRRPIGPMCPAATSPATAHAWTPTATSGSWAALTTFINVSGHRLGTMEVESALVAHPKVAEAAVVGRPDELKGQAISAFVSLESGNEPSDGLKDELRKWVSKEIGSLARPDDIRFTEALPKTRSGKIMRRLLRELATHGEIKGDVTTLEDFTVIAKLREAEEG